MSAQAAAGERDGSAPAGSRTGALGSVATRARSPPHIGGLGEVGLLLAPRGEDRLHLLLIGLREGAAHAGKGILLAEPRLRRAGPGSTICVGMPKGASSSASASVKAFTAALLAV